MKNLFKLSFSIIALSFCAIQNTSAQVQPTVNACCVTRITPNTTSLYFTWARGNGDACLVTLRVSTNGAVAPVDATTYGSSSVFGSGSYLGSGNYVVYIGGGTGVTVTGLAPGTQYTAEVFEYNYLAFPYLKNYTPNGGALAMYTLANQPTIAPSGLNITGIGPTGANAAWTNGNGTFNDLFIRQATSYSGTPIDGTQYYWSNCYGGGTSVGSSSPYAYTIYDGSSTSIGVSCLSPWTDYSSAVYTYNGQFGANNFYPTATYDFFTTLATEPTANDNFLNCTDASDNAFTVSWMKQLVGSGSNSLVTIALGSVNNFLPVDMTQYIANAQYGFGSQIGSAYVIYNGTGNGLRVTGLTPGAQYTVAVYEFNGGAGTFNRTENYYTAAYVTNSQSTNSAEPTIAASNLVLTPSTNSVTASWTSGNGAKRVLEVKPYRVKTALAFDGTNDYVDVPYNYYLQPTSALTVEAWAYKPDWSLTGGWQTIAGNTETGGYSLFSDYGYIYASVQRNNSIGYAWADISYLTPGWHHFAMTYDGRYEYVYVDGSRVGQNDAGANYPINYSYSNSFMIGADVGTTNLPTGNYFSGYIDEVRVWNVAKTILEIRNARNNSLDGNETGLMGEWKLDEGFATSSLARNNTINLGIDGTLNNMTTTAANSFSGTSGWILSGSGIDNPVNFNTYVGNSVFPNGDVCGNRYQTSYNGTGNSQTVTGLTPGTYYNFCVTEFNNTTGYNNYLRSTYLTQDVQTLGAPIPTIANFTPTNGAVGTVVTINGTNFDPTTTNNTVFFGPVKANVVSATATQLKVVVPYCTDNAPIYVTVNTEMVHTNLPFTVTSSCTAPINPSSFTTTNITSGTTRYGLCSGDMDLDGKSDLLSIDYSGGYFSIFKNASSNGTITWGPTTNFTTSPYPYNMNVADLDGDGKLDPVVASYSPGSLDLFRNTSTLTTLSFASKLDLPTLIYPSTICFADIDKDGKLDIIINYSSLNYFSIFRNTSSVGYLSFAPRIDYATTSDPHSIAVGDIDGDGKADIVYGTTSTNTFTCYRNTSSIGSITFAAAVPVGTTAPVGGIALTDMDNDGKLDVVLTHQAAAQVKIYKNNNVPNNITAGNFVNTNTLTTLANYPISLAIYDYDGDNRMDIAVGYNSGSASTSIFEQTGSLVFGAKVDFAGSGSYSFFNVADDFSMDGKTDLAVSNYNLGFNIYNNVMNPLVSEPTSASSGISFTGVTQTQLTLNFTAGNGSNRIIIAHQGSAATIPPFDGVGYTPNTIFGSGTDLGGGNYVVYNSNGNSVTVTGLQSYTPYYFSIYEYNGNTCTTNYLTTSFVSGNTTTLNTPPTISAITNPPAICQNSGLQVQNIAGIGTGSGTEIQTLTVTATSSNQTLLPNGNISVNYTSPNPTGSINYTTVNGQFGTAIVTVSVNDNATNNNITQQTFTVTVNSNPTTSNAGPNQNICTSSTSLAGNTPGVGTGTWSIIYTSNGSITIANLNNPSSAISNFLVNDSVRLAWTISNAPCASSVTYVSIKRGNCPLDANFVASQTNICGSSTNITYTDLSTAQSTTITTWSWSFPGGTPSSVTGQGPHIVAYSAPGVYTASLQVTDNTSTTNTEIKVNYITLTALPANAGTISGNLNVCQGQTGATYSVPIIAGATTYNWTVPTGGTIVSGQGTSNIVVDYSTSASTGNVTVTGQNSCGSGGQGFQLVNVTPLPANTGTITGSTTVCQGQVGVTYSVTAINNATGYSWVVPNGANITSGNNTQNITVTYTNLATSGAVNVFGTNGCGTGISNSALNITVSPLPDAAGAITGANTVCQGDTAIYSINLLGNTNGYSWSVPTGATIIAGNNTSSITVAYSNTSINGNVSVYGVNACGNGTSASLAITVNPLPGAATSIVGNATICAGNNNGIYFVSAISNATGYNWTLPPGVTINTGNNTNAIVISVSPTATSGQITVYGTNACGNGVSSFLNLTISPLPAAAGTITGNTTVCQAQTGVVYTVPTIANATGYNWTVPLGANIVSGNNTSSITVDYSVSALSGYVTVIGTNTCGLGLNNDSLAIIVNPLPGDAGPIRGDSSIQICTMQTGVMYHIDSVANATSYSWSIPSGASIVGSTTNDTIYVDYTLGAATGTMYVTPINACGNGATSSKPIIVDTVMSVNICMVTVNNNSSFNHVIWEKPITTSIDSFRIYREISSSFLPIGTVGYTDFSEYVDSVYTPIADPNTTNYRYKISALDSCGNESMLSPHHRTIFLQANQGVGNVVNLNWVQYEGNTVNQYYIYRDTTGIGPMLLLDSVPGSNFVYTDQHPSTNPNTLRYVLGVDWSTVCNPTIKNNVNILAAINNSHSNIKNLIFVPNGIVNLDQAYGLNIYPNPNNGLFYITLKDLGLRSSHFTIFDELGQVVMTDNILGNSQGGVLTKTIDLSSMANGIYSIRIEIEGSITTKKLVIQK